ncbi:unnamed protein product [Sphagnum jensenii]|uniref:Uncharacterized protein n=1 Tax=Sphagnum jensenii TaxID=128206 RepID=A0ABP0V6Y3_9BRYO
MYRILCVEDAIEVQIILRRILTPQHEVTFVTSLQEARDFLLKSLFDMMLLDINLPDGDGLRFCSELRGSEAYKDLSIIILTASTTMSEKTIGFQLGIEDFVSKPFEPLELKLRVESRLKKLSQSRERGDTLNVGALRIDFSNQRAAIISDGERSSLDFSTIEFKLLGYLAKNIDQVKSREQIISAVWSDGIHISDRTVDSHISRIRRKLKNVDCVIEAVQNSGPVFAGEISPEVAQAIAKPYDITLTADGLSHGFLSSIGHHFSNNVGIFDKGKKVGEINCEKTDNDGSFHGTLKTKANGKEQTYKFTDYDACDRVSDILKQKQPIAIELQMAFGDDNPLQREPESVTIKKAVVQCQRDHYGFAGETNGFADAKFFGGAKSLSCVKIEPTDRSDTFKVFIGKSSADVNHLAGTIFIHSRRTLVDGRSSGTLALFTPADARAGHEIFLQINETGLTIESVYQGSGIDVSFWSPSPEITGSFKHE